MEPGNNTGFSWNAVYDGLGRRLFTEYTATVGGTASPMQRVESFYDPEVEFLVMQTSTRIPSTGAYQRYWHIYGPDADGGYGASQGIGALEGIVQDGLGVYNPIRDVFGNVGAIRFGAGTSNWSASRTLAYGPAPGVQPVSFEKNSWNYINTLNWQGRRIDPTGLYWMGARYYDPKAGRFISPDPLGVAASMTLYDYADGDPVNNIDADGRIMSQQAQFEIGKMQGVASFALDGIKSLPAMAYSTTLPGGLEKAYAAYQFAQNPIENSQRVMAGLSGMLGDAVTQFNSGAQGRGQVLGYGGATVASMFFGYGEAKFYQKTESTVASFIKVGDEVSDAAPARGPITWVNETVSDVKALAYERGAVGWVEGKAPRLSTADLEGTVSAKFDGVQDGVMIDRKLSVTTFPKTQQQALRQSAVAAENGYTIRWEVPTNAEAKRAVDMFDTLGIKNIQVVVVPIKG